MAAFNVTALPNFGYNETSYIDPMEERWRAKPYVQSDYTGRTGDFSDSAIVDRVEYMAGLNPYAHVANLTEALDAYWANQNTRRDAGSDERTAPVPRYRRFQI